VRHEPTNGLVESHNSVLVVSGLLQLRTSYSICDFYSGVARNLIGGGVYVLTSHCSFKTRVNVPHVNKTVTDLGGVYILIYPPSLRPWIFTAGFSA